VLTTHHLPQYKERLERCALFGDRDLVFATNESTPFDTLKVTKRSFKLLLEKADVPHIPFHATHHTCAMLMLCAVASLAGFIVLGFTRSTTVGLLTALATLAVAIFVLGTRFGSETPRESEVGGITG
jgi:hypothetical protein